MTTPIAMSGVPGGGTTTLPLPVHTIESPAAIDPDGNPTCVPSSIVKTRVPSGASEGLGGTTGKASNGGGRVARKATIAPITTVAATTKRTRRRMRHIVRFPYTTSKGADRRDGVAFAP